MTNYITDHLSREEADSLLILHFKIARAVPADHIKKLELNNWITKDAVKGGWLTTSKTRNWVRNLRR